MMLARRPKTLAVALRSVAVTAGTALALAVAPAPTAAQTFLTETFNQVRDDSTRFGFTGDIHGTGMTFTDGIGEVVIDGSGGRGKYLWMRLGWYTLDYDPVTNIGTSTVQATRRFDLFAGTTYTLSFDWSRQGFSSGNGPFPFSLTAMLGSASLRLDDNAGFFMGENWQSATLTFTPLATELNAIIAFAGSGFAYSGLYLDNISMVGVAGPTPPAPGVVPEPSTWAMLLTGFVGLAATGRRRSARSRAHQRRAAGTIASA